MSWLMYAKRSTMRTILPSSVSGSTGPGVLEDPVAHLPVRLRPRPSRSSRSTTRSECSLWRKPRPPRSRSDLVERLLAGVAERRMAEVVAEADRLGEILVQPQRARDAARDAGGLERVREPRAEVVALGVDEDLRLVPQPAERLRVDDAVAVALERRPQRGIPPPGASRPRDSYERTASGESHRSSCSRTGLRRRRQPVRRSPASASQSSG